MPNEEVKNPDTRSYGELNMDSHRKTQWRGGGGAAALGLRSRDSKDHPLISSQARRNDMNHKSFKDEEELQLGEGSCCCEDAVSPTV